MTNSTNITLGFSTGALHTHMQTREALRCIRSAGCTAAELGFVKLERMEADGFDALTPDDMAGFSWMSLHAPKYEYGQDAKTREIFARIARVHAMRPLDLVVFHPDCILDFGVFRALPFPVAFENMDNKKASHQTPAELAAILSEGAAYKLVLDVNHIYSNDSSMRLADGFYGALRDRIAEFHVSGYAGYHDPLFRTQQTEILRAIRDYRVPMIIESVLAPDEVLREKKYVFNYFNSRKAAHVDAETVS